MSKKITINISNKLRPNLSKLFHTYIIRKSSEYNEVDEYAEMMELWDRLFPGWDEDLNDDEICVVDNIKDKSRRNKRKHKKNKRGRHKSVGIPFDGWNDEDDDIDYDYTISDYDDGHKEIWFYNDYHDKSDRVCFTSLDEFSEYCDSMGYYIPSNVSKELSYRYESHCCLNQEYKQVGILQILTGHSYGDMFYEACDSNELSN